MRIEHVALLMLYTILTLANSWFYKGMKGIHWFSLYTAFALLGAIAVVLRGQIPDALSIVGGNLFVVVAYLLLFLSLAELFGRKASHLYVQIGLVLAGTITMLEYGWLHPDTKTRLIAYSMVLGCQQAQIAFFICRKQGGGFRKVSGPMAFTLLALALTNIIRVVGIFAYGAPSDYIKSGPFLAWIVLITSCLQGGAMVAYVWMTAAMLRRDLELQASTDPLTGLLNRRAIELAAERAMILAAQTRDPLSAVTIDVDDFKKINDSFGHSCGDAALISVAASLQRNLRQNDLLARTGGDEFSVLLPSTSIEEAMEVAERLRNAVEGTLIFHGSLRIRVTASFGLSESDSSTPDWHYLVHQCDHALYNVKRAGGNLIASTDHPSPVSTLLAS